MAQGYVNPGADAGGDGTTSALTGGSCAYQSLSIWEAARQGVLLADEIVDCAGTTADSTAFTIDGFTPGIYSITIRAAAGQEAQMPWSTSRYRLTAEASTLTVSDDAVRIQRIQMENTDATNNGRYVLQATNTGLVLEGLLTRSAGSGTNAKYALRLNPATGTTQIVRNCVAYGATGGASVAIRIAGGGSGSVAMDNCTAYGSVTGFALITGACVARNCLGAANTTDFSGSWTAGTINNASQDATAPGTSSRASQTFTFVNAAGGDFHLGSADAGAKDYGTDLSGTFTTDFDGVARSGSWDIGADEYVAAATASLLPPPSPMRHHILR